MPEVDNAELVRALRELAALLAEGSGSFRAHGLAKAAQSIEALQRPVVDLWRLGGLPALTALPWIGSHVALTLVELVTLGRIAELERLRQATFSSASETG